MPAGVAREPKALPGLTAGCARLLQNESWGRRVGALRGEGQMTAAVRNCCRKSGSSGFPRDPPVAD